MIASLLLASGLVAFCLFLRHELQAVGEWDDSYEWDEWPADELRPQVEDDARKADL